jgi:circadian clock protein KaiB
LDETGTSSSAGGGKRLHFRLYVAGSSPGSLRAIEMMKKLCAGKLAGAGLEIVDIYQPKKGNESQALVMTAPAVVRLNPEPRVRYYGDFMNAEQLMQSLTRGLEPHCEGDLH